MKKVLIMEDELNIRSFVVINLNGAGTKDTRILRFKKSPVEYIYGV